MKTTLLLLALALFAGCSTMPVKHKEVVWPQGQCLPNSQRFQQAHAEQVGGWSRIIIVSYYAESPSFQGVQMAARRTRDTAPTRHAIVACEYQGKIWIYDDAVIGSPYPLRVQSVNRNDANRIAYWTNQPNFKSAEFYETP